MQNYIHISFSLLWYIIFNSRVLKITHAICVTLYCTNKIYVIFNADNSINWYLERSANLIESSKSYLLKPEWVKTVSILNSWVIEFMSESRMQVNPHIEMWCREVNYHLLHIHWTCTSTCHILSYLSLTTMKNRNFFF